MYNVKDGLAFTANMDGSVIILRNGGIIATLTNDDWVSVITHMANTVSVDLAEVHKFAEALHAGEPALQIKEPTKT